MAIRLKQALVLLGLQVAAFWPVWRWQAARVTDSSDDAWGWVALLTAILMVIRFKNEANNHTPKLWLPALLTFVYAFSFPFLTPLPRAILAMIALGATLSICFFRSTFQLSIGGLLLLSLPVMASLQFYLGFPLRATVAAIAAPLLQLGGLVVVREGTCLNWNGLAVSVDAPCSGIKMLWTGMYLTFTLAGLFRLNARRTAAAAMLAFVAILLGNILRAVALFYLEAGIVNLPERFSGAAHSAVGVMMFLLTALTIGWLVARLKTENPTRLDLCEPFSSSLSAAR
ncbi:MAG TPA: archaeosortase/exosortase family protein [Blastocatellia bacterium]|nr:archaeosortase/exosortase family protein [Blastocatellia bacterium]HMV83496.1 archaeosortase/exosortase family protein [Blastocatellia bacterium]HMY75030.1 archaeosortase/exosortase family protein [Blastocatellia bacterium]HMZ20122.1 archaeosortase/exosortase family protein [Blastocatellia bacterium]HNG30870.1 archaeosortase/exosortase family protein [Blastocatellia bacterium]